MNAKQNKTTKTRKAAVWAASLSSIVAIGLGLLNAHHDTHAHEVCNCDHHKETFEGGASSIEVHNEPYSNSASTFGVLSGLPGQQPTEQFLSTAMLNVLPGFYPYTGENRASYCDQPIFVKDYFRNLKTNLATNGDAQNCGYVGLAMLLSYYDTYWNSSFIDDRYNNAGMTHLDALSDNEFISPGINDLFVEVWNENNPKPAEPGPNASDQAKQRYNSIIRSTYNTYLEKMVNMPEIVDHSLISYLYRIAMGNDVGVLAYNTHPIPTLFFNELKMVADKYFSNSDILRGLVTFSYSSIYKDDVFSIYQTEEEKQQALRSFIINKVKKGQPVLVGGNLRNDQGGEGGGHYVVAYEYDEQSDSIYVHPGLKQTNSTTATRANMDELYYSFNSYGYIEIANALRYSVDNLRFEVNGVGYNTCSLSSHCHGYEGRIDYDNPGVHAAQCPCGSLKYAFHKMKPFVKNLKKCAFCSYTIVDPDWRPSYPWFLG
ncbi:MAG: hypothetical protein K6F36_00565 [Bacilli bacterium]|nr:hypothetical protein [Bacilli bacterium]